MVRSKDNCIPLSVDSVGDEICSERIVFLKNNDKYNKNYFLMNKNSYELKSKSFVKLTRKEYRHV